jgi:hypothetical protein
MAIYKNLTITREFLDSNPTAYFVFGDNIERRGTGGAAVLRDHPHAIGFITKKFPDNKDESFYKPEEYSSVFFEELKKLKTIIEKRPEKTFYIIWDKLIRHNLVRALELFDNVVFCWKDSWTN